MNKLNGLKQELIAINEMWAKFSAAMEAGNEKEAKEHFNGLMNMYSAIRYSSESYIKEIEANEVANLHYMDAYRKKAA